MDLCHIKNMGLSGKLDETDTDTGSRFPIKIIVSLGFNFSEGTQTDSKSNKATF